MNDSRWIFCSLLPANHFLTIFLGSKLSSWAFSIICVYSPLSSCLPRQLLDTSGQLSLTDSPFPAHTTSSLTCMVWNRLIRDDSPLPCPEVYAMKFRDTAQHLLRDQVQHHGCYKSKKDSQWESGRNREALLSLGGAQMAEIVINICWEKTAVLCSVQI